MKVGYLAEAKPLASFSSDCGFTSKMWILPDGRVVALGEQHFRWALANAHRLLRDYGINVRRIRPLEDTPIRMCMLRHGAVRVNYEHRGGRLLLEAYHKTWGRPQQQAFRAIVVANSRDISLVRVRLLNARTHVVQEETVNLIEETDCARGTKLPFMNSCKPGS